MNPRLCLAGFALCVSAFAAEEKPAVPFRAIPFDEACKAAAAEQKIVFIDFFTTWCGPCKELDRTTWNDPAVAKLLGEKAVPLKIDAEKEVALANRYKIEAYPTLLLLKADGAELDRIVGYREATKFSEEFTAGLSGKNSLTRARDAVAAAPADHDAVQARYQLAQTLARSNQPAEALKEYLWCYDEGMVQVASFVGVRSSFLISSIAQLGAKYPPALAALRERRDAAELRMNEDPNDRSAAMDFASLNGALKENDRTLAAFDKLPPDDPRRAPMLVRAYGLLIEARRYSDAAQAKSFKKMVAQFEQLQREMAQQAERSAPNGRPDPFHHYVIHSTTQDIEVLAGAGQLGPARVLADKLLAFDDSDETREAVRTAAARAGYPELEEKTKPAAK